MQRRSARRLLGATTSNQIPGARPRVLRLLTATLGVTILTAVVGVSAGFAELTPVSDMGVSLTAAQSTVTPGSDAFLTGQVYNDGTVPQLDVKLIVNLGGKLDPGYTAEPLLQNGTCAPTAQSTATNDIVACSFGTMAAGVSSALVHLAVMTPLTGSVMTSVASYQGTPNSTVPVVNVQDGDETRTVVTSLVANSGQGALSDGDSMTSTSADGEITQRFVVPNGATNGGIVIVRQSEANTTAQGITCEGQVCHPAAAQTQWTQVGGTTPSINNPFQNFLTYNLVHTTCNGLGGPSGCLPIYFTNAQTGDATRVPLSTGYSPSRPVPIASSDPALFSLDKTAGGVVTYGLACITDQIIPILGP